MNGAEPRLKDKICLITGSNRGIGRAVAERFASEGATVIAAMRDLSYSDDFSFPVVPMCLDVTKESDIREVIKNIKSQFGRLDVLVNNAGIVTNEPLGMISRNSLRDIFDVNVFGLLDLSQQVANRFMRRQEYGSIINIASLVGLKGAAGQCAYSASKGAVISLTYSMAKELAPYKIRVNAIAPGIIGSERIKEWMNGPYKDAVNRILMGRIGTPEEVAAAGVYFASDDSLYTTGQVLSIDGENIF